ncbi:contactin-5-like [Acropora palmata]|uniref:contactin-5-like n=1 Tax=Acropora palmata TaxID=6131 RepID=UPI003D9FBD72
MAVQLHISAFAFISLATLIEVSFADEFPVNFTLKPKDAEYFVGREAIFRWGYHIRNSDNVESIQFGKVAPPEDDASAIEYVAILVKDLHSQGKVKRNNKHRTDVISYVSGRTSVIENETASFKIVNLTLNDTGKYYCRLQLNNSFSVIGKNTDCVQLKVVDIMINYQDSTLTIESWKGHKITLRCAVKKAFQDSEVRFFWEQKDNRLHSLGRQVDWKTLSEMTFISVTDAEFNPVTCIAKTKTTTQRLEIKIKRLCKPSEPVNVTVREIQSNNRSCKLYYKLNWDPPVDSGNIPITKYLVESHPVINRRKNRTVTYSTEHTVCKVQTSDHPDELIVNIRGVNKVGHGLKSENIKMLFYRTPSAPLNLTSSMSPRKEDPPFDVRLHWSPPNENGGKAVQQYLLEYKVLEEPWESAKAVKTNETNMMFIQPKDETYIYEIRISASNEFGFGTISEVMRVYFAETPGPPRNLDTHKSKTPYLTITWEAPTYDGGAAVTKYIVEYKTVKTEWSAAINVTVYATKFSFPANISETYAVRVRAVNSLGKGNPSNFIFAKLTEDDLRTLRRSNVSSGIMSGSDIIHAFLLLLAVCFISA